MFRGTARHLLTCHLAWAIRTFIPPLLMCRPVLWCVVTRFFYGPTFYPPLLVCRPVLSCAFWPVFFCFPEGPTQFTGSTKTMSNKPLYWSPMWKIFLDNCFLQNRRLQASWNLLEHCVTPFLHSSIILLQLVSMQEMIHSTYLQFINECCHALKGYVSLLINLSCLC